MYLYLISVSHTDTDMPPNMGHLLYKELLNSSGLSLEKRQLKRIMKEVCKINSTVTKRMRSQQLLHCFLKTNSWNGAQVKPWSQH